MAAKEHDAVVTQAPEQHWAEAAHALPHVPQLAGSVWVDLHVPEQSDCPDGHEAAPSSPTPPLLLPLLPLLPPSGDGPEPDDPPPPAHDGKAPPMTMATSATAPRIDRVAMGTR